jgi:hypothetical protein
MLFESSSEYSTNVTRETRIVVHVSLVIVNVDFEFAQVRASWNVATQRAFFRMPQQVILQCTSVFVKLAAHFAREFLNFVLFRVLLKCNCRREMFLAILAQTLEDSWRLRPMIFDVKIEVI